MKRNFLLLTAITFCLSLFLSVLALNPANAYADEVTINKVQGYDSYELSYLVKDAGYTYEDGMTFTLNGVKVEKPSTEAGGVTEEAQQTAGFRTTDGKKVEFLQKTTYTLIATKSDETSLTITIDTTALPEAGSLSYDLTDAKLQSYKNSVQQATKVKDKDSNEERNIRVDDDFIVPNVIDLVKDKFFDVEDLTGTLYYSVPQSSSYSTKSISNLDSVKFTVSKVGTYSFYILVKNNFVSLSTTDLVQGNGGFYQKDADGNAVGDVVIPVFYFNVEASSTPKITVGSSEKAYQKLEYTVDCFTIVASDYNTEYVLYYSETLVDVSGVTDFDSDNLKALGLIEVTKENHFSDKNLFNSSAKTFTPEKKGYYYVVLHVVDFANEHATVISGAIDATNELKQVKYESEFLKYNWVSVMLLSIAVLCFVAIIVLLCVKPKETNTLSTKK